MSGSLNMDLLTPENRDAFLKERPTLLDDKHQTTIDNIKQLQDIEKYLFQNLQSIFNSVSDVKSSI